MIEKHFLMCSLYAESRRQSHLKHENSKRIKVDVRFQYFTENDKMLILVSCDKLHMCAVESCLRTLAIKRFLRILRVSFIEMCVISVNESK